MNELVVIESPYAGPDAASIEANVAYARRCMADCLARGELPYASHLLFTQPGILRDDVPEERKRGIAAGLAWGARAGLVVVYTDRGVSTGMIEGIRAARRRGTRIVIRNLDEASAAENAKHARNVHELLTGEWMSDERIRELFDERLRVLADALAPLVAIADAYDANDLDDEARKRWGKNLEHETTRTPEEIKETELYAGRGGRRLLTLGDAFRARRAVRGT